MGKKLAIKGHRTRGKEVIELLQMMGGENSLVVSGYKLSGYEPFNLYYINDNGVINYKYHSLDKDMIVFTIEEFLEKYPFRAGDKVLNGCGDTITIKSMGWSENCETMLYDFKDSVSVLSAEDLLKYNAEFLVNKEKSEEVGKMLCDMTLNHLHGNHLKIVLSELYEHIKSTSKEELEREFKEIESEGWTNVGPTVEEFMDFCNKVNKKPTYPKTIEGCVKLLGVDFRLDMDSYKRKLMSNFYRLIICRDAYWKIAGEQMGLGKPWEPDWNEETDKFTISNKCNKIYLNNTAWYAEVLAFPTEGTRDVFFNNFKDLIESCKELL